MGSLMSKKNAYSCSKFGTSESEFLWTDVYDMYGNEAKWCTRCALIVDERSVIYNLVIKLKVHPSWLRPLPRELIEQTELRDQAWFDKIDDAWTEHIIETLKQPEYGGVVVEKIGGI
jgi:hypothetical protein